GIVYCNLFRIFCCGLALKCMVWQMLTVIKNKLEKLSGYLLVFFVLILSFSLARNIMRINKAKTRIQEAQERVDKLEEEKAKLGVKLEVVEGDEFIEKQMRDKLGLAKEGEVVVILPDDEILRKLAPNYKEEEETLPEPNWRRWARLFL
ncbi:septum formation initiator family protein, partial [Patescibacteria group bacterium]|nr:septum formation initiator family protein [Patescibacteria group bacterium]